MAGNVKLSKHLLQMKFMQRSVLRMEEEQNAEEKQRVIDDEHWVLDLPQLSQREERYMSQPSAVFCENLQFGRMSFKGFNPEVEKLMRLQNTESELKQAEEREKEIGVSEDEMVNRYSALVGIIAKKFSTKRKHQLNTSKQDDSDNEESDPSPPKVRRQFMKPDDS